MDKGTYGVLRLDSGELHTYHILYLGAAEECGYSPYVAEIAEFCRNSPLRKDCSRISAELIFTGPEY